MKVSINGILQTPQTERELFEILQMDYVPPSERSVQRYRQARAAWTMRQDERIA